MKLNLRGKKREFISSVGKSLNILLPTEANTSSRGDNLTAIWLSQDEWMIYSNDTLNSKNNDYEVENLLNKIRDQNLLDKNGIIVLHRHKNETDSLPPSFQIIEQKVYGISKIIFLSYLN